MIENDHVVEDRAGVAQLVERLLPKQEVTGPNPVTRFPFIFS